MIYFTHTALNICYYHKERLGKKKTLILGRGKHTGIKVGKSTAFGETNMYAVG